MKRVNSALFALLFASQAALGQSIPFPGPGAASAGPQLICLTTGTTWTVPSDWNNANNSIEAIGGGGGGADGEAAPGVQGAHGEGQGLGRS